MIPSNHCANTRAGIFARIAEHASLQSFEASEFTASISKKPSLQIRLLTFFLSLARRAAFTSAENRILPVLFSILFICFNISHLKASNSVFWAQIRLFQLNRKGFNAVFRKALELFSAVLPQKSFVKPLFSAKNDCFMKTVNKLLTISTIPPMGIYLLLCTRKTNMQVPKAKSFQIYFPFFFVSALDKSSYRCFPVKQSFLSGVHRSLTAFLKAVRSSIYR